MSENRFDVCVVGAGLVGLAVARALVDTYVELYTQAVNEAGSLDAVDGVLMQQIIQQADFRPLDLYRFNYGEGMRSTNENRMAAMYFVNATMDGIATSGEDALTVDAGDGTSLFIPQIVPLNEFTPAPDLRPGGADAPEE